MLETYGKQSGLVLATGGGCVTQPRNYPLLRQNSLVVWLKRDLGSLPTDGRPLSQAGRLEEMYRVREHLYNAFSDTSVESDEHSVENILAYLEGTP